MPNALSIDVEDYFQVSAFESIVRYEDWGKYESRVVKNTQRILSILGEYDVKATFFVLGWAAERFPDLICEIHEKGHEIASHGFAHKLVYKQSPNEFHEDITKGKDILEAITGEPVVGYRAPSYSITERSLWALDILSEEGYKYDSSIFPIRHDRYGIPRAERFIHKIDHTPNGGILEFPLSTVRLFGTNFPIAGGGYLRLLPVKFIRWGIRQINGEGQPAIVYLHPWEIDPEQPRMNINGLAKFRHYLNLSKNVEKLRELLSTVNFSTVRDVINWKRYY